MINRHRSGPRRDAHQPGPWLSSLQQRQTRRAGFRSLSLGFIYGEVVRFPKEGLSGPHTGFKFAWLSR